MGRLREVLRHHRRAVAGWALVVAAGVVVAAGWYGVSGEADVARQMPFVVSGGLAGVVLAIVGVSLIAMDDLRDERRRLGRLEAELLEIKEMLLDQAKLLADERASEPGPRRRKPSS